MKIAIFGSHYQNLEQISHIFDVLSTNHVEIFVHDIFYDYLKSEFALKTPIAGTISCNKVEADMAISIGGDGTFLRTATIIGNKNIPIIGINTGRLGFLADVKDTEIDDALNDILSDNYRIEERNMLHLALEGSSINEYPYALNEIAVLKQDTASMLSIHAYINGEYLTTYESDGLIIATPTGSTAYSLSVGGPIMSPDIQSLILTAIAPHSLNARPLVVNNDSIIKLELESRSDSFLISVDGRSQVVNAGTKLSITQADFKLKVVKRLCHTFYGTLREKLKWGTDPRE